MGELLPMPKRYRSSVRNEEPAPPVGDDGSLPAEPAKKKKKSNFWGYAKWVGAIGLGSVIGGLSMRAYDRYIGGRRRNGAEPGSDMPMLNPAPAVGSGVSLNIMPPQIMQPMFPTAPPAQAVHQNPSDMTVPELAQLLKRKKSAQRARRNRHIEEEFWDE